ncbi:MAG: hypothetical protein QM820_04480 [Minicystis sp.]
MSSCSSWITVEAAADFLGMPVVTLRRSFEPKTQSTPEGGTVSRLNGITARRIGRLWRVWLHDDWTDPAAGAR